MSPPSPYALNPNPKPLTLDSLRYLQVSATLNLKPPLTSNHQQPLTSAPYQPPIDLQPSTSTSAQLYVPASLLHNGANDIVIFETDMHFCSSTPQVPTRPPTPLKSHSDFITPTPTLPPECFDCVKTVYLVSLPPYLPAPTSTPQTTTGVLRSLAKRPDLASGVLGLGV